MLQIFIMSEHPKWCIDCEIIQECRGDKYLKNRSLHQVGSVNGSIGFCSYYGVVAWVMHSLESLFFLRWLYESGKCEGAPALFNGWDDEFLAKMDNDYWKKERGNE